MKTTVNSIFKTILAFDTISNELQRSSLVNIKNSRHLTQIETIFWKVANGKLFALKFFQFRLFLTFFWILRSPDGCSLLTNSDDRILRIFTLPNEFYDSNFDCDTSKRLNMMNKITNGEIVYDFCWYPFVSHPNTHCTMIASTCRDHPIHLWDVAENKIQSTFTAINHLVTSFLRRNSFPNVKFNFRTNLRQLTV